MPKYRVLDRSMRPLLSRKRTVPLRRTSGTLFGHDPNVRNNMFVYPGFLEHRISVISGTAKEFFGLRFFYNLYSMNLQECGCKCLTLLRYVAQTHDYTRIIGTVEMVPTHDILASCTLRRTNNFAIC